MGLKRREKISSRNSKDLVTRAEGKTKKIEKAELPD